MFNGSYVVCICFSLHVQLKDFVFSNLKLSKYSILQYAKIHV